MCLLRTVRLPGRHAKFVKHSNHWKRALKIIFKVSGCFQFAEAVVTSTAKDSLAVL